MHGKCKGSASDALAISNWEEGVKNICQLRSIMTKGLCPKAGIAIQSEDEDGVCVGV